MSPGYPGSFAPGTFLVPDGYYGPNLSTYGPSPPTYGPSPSTYGPNPPASPSDSADGDSIVTTLTDNKIS